MKPLRPFPVPGQIQGDQFAARRKFWDAVAAGVGSIKAPAPASLMGLLVSTPIDGMVEIISLDTKTRLLLPVEYLDVLATQLRQRADAVSASMASALVAANVAIDIAAGPQ